MASMVQLKAIKHLLGAAFQRWRELKEWEGLELDAEVALFLLDK
uniref:Uncharacterized protein n=2 Tax=Cyprinus carpio TaxID=7962 RepID=A0A9J8AJ55_CYPCA